jgi:hypothetical protein
MVALKARYRAGADRRRPTEGGVLLAHPALVVPVAQRFIGEVAQ